MESLLRKRDSLYDIVKGLGIILVVWGHSGIVYGHYIIYMFHMPLFMFVSGALHKQRPVSTIWSDKVKTMLIIYVKYYLITFILDILIFGYDNVSMSILNPSQSSGPLWYILSLIWVYLMYSVIYNLANQKYTMCIVGILSSISFLLFHLKVELPLFVDSSLSLLIYYWGGHLSVRYIRSESFQRFGWIFIPLLGVCYKIDFSLLHLGINDYWSNTLMDNLVCLWLAGFIGSYAVLWIALLIARKCGRYSTPLVLLGKNSLYIFAFHFTVLHILQLIHPTEDTLLLVAYIIVSIGVSVFIPYIKGFSKQLFRIIR